MPTLVLLPLFGTDRSWETSFALRDLNQLNPSGTAAQPRTAREASTFGGQPDLGQAGGDHASTEGIDILCEVGDTFGTAIHHQLATTCALNGNGWRHSLTPHTPARAAKTWPTY